MGKNTEKVLKLKKLSRLKNLRKFSMIKITTLKGVLNDEKDQSVDYLLEVMDNERLFYLSSYYQAN